jgi:hypothetical protein
MPDERARIRREVIAELVELAEQHRAGHEQLHQAAVEHGREEMEQRAYANWNAWAEVWRILRFELNRPGHG